MLTVLVRYHGGSEDIFTDAIRVHVVPEGTIDDDIVSRGPGVYVTFLGGNEMCFAFNSKAQSLAGHAAELAKPGVHNPAVYVMNTEGKTVARYPL